MCNHKIHKPQSNHKPLNAFVSFGILGIRSRKLGEAKRGGTKRNKRVDNLKKDVVLSSSGREKFATKGGWNR